MKIKNIDKSHIEKLSPSCLDKQCVDPFKESEIVFNYKNNVYIPDDRKILMGNNLTWELE